MRVWRLVWTLAVVVSPIAGCTGVTTRNTAPFTLAVLGKDTEDGPRVELEGAQVCQTGTPNCALSDDRGRVTIQLPIGEESSFTVERDGYASYIAPVMLADAVELTDPFEMASNKLMVARHESAMSSYPMIGAGTILLGLNSPFAGATFDLVDATGKAFYYDEEATWSLDLTETTSYGWGGFVEVPPGDSFEVELGGTAEDCLPGWAWPGEAEEAVRFPIQENYVTVVTVTCPPPP